MATIHWIGTGLSAIPGLRRLIENGHTLVVWNRSIDKAIAAVGDITDDIRVFDFDRFVAALNSGDIAVSMLPAAWHVKIASACIDAGAHFASSSYISPEMSALNSRATEAGVTLINEVGLDPGIDHLMAHHLVADYKASAGYGVDNEITFRSYCGGVPKIPNDFRYKFSWSPLGVLTALRSPSKSIKDGQEWHASRPWDAISTYDAPLPQSEEFEVYPNRNSLPFIAEYNFDPRWPVQTFVRGTLRLQGWAHAWGDVFREIETLSGPEGDARLKEMSDQFWADNAYGENEPDRVVMCVELTARKDGVPAYSKTYVMDAWGDQNGTAMAKLVSVPLSLAIEAVLRGEIDSGVHAAPSDPSLIAMWMQEVGDIAQHLQIKDALA
ncbi:hypothetical protein GCM10007939_02180 [Amylibacter marinus]|uniref:Saccharopine dehydrogenase (NADP+, L-glutamate forming) n=1 Tax=Amylibacter marinus TaxID=1475483 RepID=A0ABQ5VR97_9RHOB|nr:saccharopine dehydrogenase family protein [Amylibacter marinus]GLQ33935.1 hypothetical protein GCM10007939_02180 [Amylibacter marinus]